MDLASGHAVRLSLVIFREENAGGAGPNATSFNAKHDEVMLDKIRLKVCSFPIIYRTSSITPYVFRRYLPRR